MLGSLGFKLFQGLSSHFVMNLLWMTNYLIIDQKQSNKLLCDRRVIWLLPNSSVLLGLFSKPSAINWSYLCRPRSSPQRGSWPGLWICLVVSFSLVSSRRFSKHHDKLAGVALLIQNKNCKVIGNESLFMSLMTKQVLQDVKFLLKNSLYRRYQSQVLILYSRLSLIQR